MILGWDAEVELPTPEAPPSLRFVHTRTWLPQAIEQLLALPRDLQDRTGISLHDPVRLLAGDRPPLQDFLTAAGARELWASAIAVAISIAAARPALGLPPGFADHANSLLASSYPANGPGASVIVTDHGRIVYQGVRGLADIAAKRPITPATVFRLGSITKQFASATVLQLAAEGKIELGAPIATYLPAFPNGQAITVAELLNHTSGIQDYTEIPGWMVEANIGHPYTTEQLIAVFKDQPVHSKPGEKWAYNNSGYILVGA